MNVDELNELINEEREIVENFLKSTVLHYAAPKIKGEITKDKLKWRGIKYCSNTDYPRKIWVFQRGKQIGDTLILRRKIKTKNGEGMLKLFGEIEIMKEEK